MVCPLQRTHCSTNASIPASPLQKLALQRESARILRYLGGKEQPEKCWDWADSWGNWGERCLGHGKVQHNITIQFGSLYDISIIQFIYVWRHIMRILISCFKIRMLMSCFKIPTWENSGSCVCDSPHWTSRWTCGCSKGSSQTGGSGGSGPGSGKLWDMLTN